MLNHLQSRTEFKDWLTSKDANDIVGKSANSRSCPIATFLTDIGAVPTDMRVSVGVSTMGAWNDNDFIPFVDTPLWTKRFILTIDRIGLSDSPVKASDCLDVLYLIEQSEEEIAETLEKEFGFLS